jgi:hypothetical protein
MADFFSLVSEGEWWGYSKANGRDWHDARLAHWLFTVLLFAAVPRRQRTT